MPIKHKFPSEVSDLGIPPGWVKPSNWNEDHDLDGALEQLDGIAPTPNVVPYFDADALGAVFAISAFMRGLMNTSSISALLTALNAAPLESPAFTGTPTAPTTITSDNSQKLATTAFVQAVIAQLVGGSPALLDTLNELAAALGNDPNFATTMTNALALKAPLNSPALTGTPTAPTATAGDASTKLANTQFVNTELSNAGAAIQTQLNGKAPLDSPVFTGDPKAPTPANGDNDTSIATTEFVQAALAAAGIVNPNRLINGTFRVFQRPQAVALTDGAYAADGAYFLTEGGTTSTCQQLNYPEAGAPSGAILTQLDATARRIGLAFPVESLDCRDLRSAAAAVSGRVKASTGTAIRWALLETTAAADAFTKDVVNNWASTTYTPGNFFTAAVGVLATGSVTPGANVWGGFSGTGNVGASANNLILFVWTETALAQNATLAFNRMKVEGGSVATAYPFRDYNEELSRCQRWYEVVVWGMTTIASTTLTNRNFSAAFAYNTTKRATPTLARSAETSTRANFIGVNFSNAHGFRFALSNSAADGDDFGASGTMTASAEPGV